MRALPISLATLTLALGARSAQAGPSVWVIDDGEKIRRDATSTPFERGEQNPVWRPGEPVRMFAARGEAIALQVVVEAADAPLGSVSVDLRELDGPGGARLVDPVDPAASPAAATRLVGRPIERFVEHFVTVRRASGGRTPGESLGWEQGAAPQGAWIGPVPDALVPVDLAAPWAAYPMRVEPHANGIVWIDVNVPDSVPAGPYRGALDVRDGPDALASIPVEVEVADLRLPDRTSGAMAYYDPEELARRIGRGSAEEHLWKVLHAHRVAALHDATRAEDVLRQRDALDGSLYAPSRGYLGPASGLGDGVLSVGAYGGLGDPDAAAAASLGAVARAATGANLFSMADVFLYADDERCSSPRGAAWRALIRGSKDPDVRRVRVAWTCSQDPATQPVDVPILLAAYDDVQVREARARGKEVWIYNGVLPRTGTFLLDADAVSPRVNGWLAAMFHVPRWLYWESTYWYGAHQRAPMDPFADTESLHNDAGDWANGDGVLLYPGAQIDAFREHSLGFDGVVASIRLKNWRRGLQDAGYLELARARDAARADAVARALIPAAFSEAGVGRSAAWSPRGEAFFDARRELRDIALGRVGASRPERATGGERIALLIGGASIAAVLMALVFAGARRKRRHKS